MQKSRIWALATTAIVGSAGVAALVSACSTYDQPKAVAAVADQVPDHPDWNWNVRPILSQNCFGCHGSGTQKAGLRLDDEKIAKGELPENKGHRAIVAGNPGKSEMLKRIMSSDPDFRMPPKDSHKTLTPLEIATVEKWVKQGAQYKQHWAYITPKEVKPERTEWDKQAVNPIDRYIYAGLKKAKLSPSPEADKETLINRVTLDLTGLPPTLKEVDAFLADKDPNAYEHLVDRLLASRQYAERQANIWLDVARYADSNGGLFDNETGFQHPYRDWVITAFQRNIPYDKFVTWQIAGDKLPNATTEQRLATAFLRAGKKDSEAGSIEEEYRTNFMNERSELMGKAFLGLTVGCAKCHNHKYDVISQADYYSMGGFFNQIDENGVFPRGAVMQWPTPTQAKNQAKARQTISDKWAAYQTALNAARQRAAKTIDALPAAQKAAYLQTAMNADMTVYLPFDTEYKGDFKELYVSPGELRPGAPDPLKPLPKLPGGLTRADYQLKLQNEVIAEQKDRKLHPEKYAAIDAAKAAAAAKKAAIAAAGSIPVGARGPGAGPGGPGARAPGARGPGARGPGAGPRPEGGAVVRASAPGGPRPEGMPGAGPGRPGFGPGKPGFGPGGKPGGFAKAGFGPGKPGAGKPGFGKPGAGGPGGLAAGGPPRPPRDPDAPRVAAREINTALDQLVDKGFIDERIADPQRAPAPALPTGLKEEKLFWTPSGIPGAKPGYLHNVKMIPGAKGQGVLLHDSVGAVYPGIGTFERTDPRTLDFWVMLRAKDYTADTRPEGPEAVILGNNGAINGLGYELSLNKGKLEYKIISNAPFNMMQVTSEKQLPRQKWVHITATYDGNSKAGGMKLYQDGQPMAVMVEKDNLTGSSKTRPPNRNSLFGGNFGLSFGNGFNKPELLDGGMDELKVFTRALTPAEVALNHSNALLNGMKPQDVRASMIEVAASKDPAVVAAWQALTDARLAEQTVSRGIPSLLVAQDIPVPRKNYIMDRGIYNSYLGEVQAQALPRVYKWDAKLPRNRLGLAQWLFDPKHPLTARVYVNRLWRDHFGTGIVQTVEDFGTQGSIPSNPELLDYLAVEFVRSGWDIKHMQKLMVMSATYRQSSTITPDRLEKDPRNFLLARGPRYRLSAEQLRDTALSVAGLLVDKPGGDSVFPVQPDLIWDGSAQGFVVYPFDVPDDQNHRRSMYTFVKRNQGPANMLVFDMPDRREASVGRTISNTPLQALVLMNDPQFLEAYRKLAERAIKSSANPDEQLTTLFRLGARRHPSARELAAMKSFRAQEIQRASASKDEVVKLLKVGNVPADASLDPVQLSAMTVVAAGVMNSPAAYTLR